MKKKFAIILICTCVVVSSLVLFFLLKKDKPKYQTVNFEITASLEQWQTLYLKCNETYTLCQKSGDIYVASITKRKGSLIRYTFVLADEWGNRYEDIAVDINGERISKLTLIKDTAHFVESLSGLKNITTSFSLTSEILKPIYLKLDDQMYAMTHQGNGYYFISLEVGIGKHVCEYYIYTNDEYVKESASTRHITVSKNSHSFLASAVFNIDTSRSMVFFITFVTNGSLPFKSVYIFLDEGYKLIKAEQQEDYFTISIDINDDCAFSIFVSTTENEEGINYDALFSAHTRDYSDVVSLYWDFRNNPEY